MLQSLLGVHMGIVKLEPFELEDHCWVSEGTWMLFPSYTKVRRGLGWGTAANLGKESVTLRLQWIIPKVSYGREEKCV